MSDLAAVVVNHDAGEVLARCVASLRDEGVDDVVVVDNASGDGSVAALLAQDPAVEVVHTGANLGYGSGANRGLAATEGALVLVSNPDVAVHPGALEALARVLRSQPATAIVGPCIREADGSRYPSARRFPSMTDAAGHALLGQIAPDNRFSRRYRMAEIDAAVTTPVDWVSGACFMARRAALEELGGFDERYFMYVEDVDLCWRAHQAGWQVLYVPEAEVTHLQGVSTARRPYRMLVAHHLSALRFASRTSAGSRRVLLPGVALVLAVRLVIAMAKQAWGARRHGGAPGAD
ncbi:MAG TPA: glycosyltransferase family 2 protein [Acidimicrobiales bacterium]|nr:glycosyltransferase family 2 protein [Acidimicrobiales bacterium]